MIANQILHQGMREKNGDMILMALKSGADLSGAYRFDETVFSFCVFLNHAPAVQFMLNQGINKSAIKSAREYAVQHGLHEMATLLA